MPLVPVPYRGCSHPRGRRRVSPRRRCHAAVGVPPTSTAAWQPERVMLAPVPTPSRIAYGDHPSQFGELTLPAGDPRAVVVVVHGGFWRERFGLELGRPLAADLVAAGYAAWNVEYRRVGGGGGWPATFDDVAAAVDFLADRSAAPGSGGGRRALGGRASRRVARRPSRAPAGRPRRGAGGAPARRGEPGRRPRPRRRGAARGGQRRGRPTCSAAARTTCPTGTPSRRRWPGSRSACPWCACTAPRTSTCRSGRASGSPRRPVTESSWCALPGVEHFAVIDPTTDAWRACRDGVERLTGSA